MTDRARPGRPRGSSRALLEEAAAELFLEQTYARTTIEQITQRAGVSRATFFNYFPAKSDLLWVDIDRGLAELPRALAASAADMPATDAVRAALLSLAGYWGPGRVPWALTQVELMRTTQEIEASALSRFMVQAGVISRFVAQRRGLLDDDLLSRSFALAALAAVAAAAGSWARSGVTRGPLAPYVDTALTPVCTGYRSVTLSGTIDSA